MTPADLASVREHIASRIIGQQKFIDSMLVCLLSDGHLLVEGMPGLAKTTAVKALAESVEGDFHRIQFTPDLLPSDLIGTDIYRHEKGEFEFRQGPLFHNVLLADEVNRAPAKVQSALLEAMGESQVSVDGELRPLDNLFFVIGTQNPIEMHGTYPLPEAQMDRFALRFGLGYIGADAEAALLDDQRLGHPLEQITPCADAADILDLREAVAQVRVSEPIRRYIVALVAATRGADGVVLGASPRASLTLMKIGQALALFDGLDYLPPEPIREAAVPVIAHRLGLETQARYSGRDAEDIVRDCLQRVPVPG